MLVSHSGLSAWSIQARIRKHVQRVGREKNQQKICGIPLGATKVLAGGLEPPDLVMVAGLLPVTFEFSVRREPRGVRPPSAPRQDHHR
jgi:hypothetical protein